MTSQLRQRRLRVAKATQEVHGEAEPQESRLSVLDGTLSHLFITDFRDSQRKDRPSQLLEFLEWECICEILHQNKKGAHLVARRGPSIPEA